MQTPHTLLKMTGKYKSFGRHIAAQWFLNGNNKIWLSGRLNQIILPFKNFQRFSIIRQAAHKWMNGYKKNRQQEGVEYVKSQSTKYQKPIYAHPAKYLEILNNP